MRPANPSVIYHRIASIISSRSKPFHQRKNFSKISSIPLIPGKLFFHLFFSHLNLRFLFSFNQTSIFLALLLHRVKIISERIRRTRNRIYHYNRGNQLSRELNQQNRYEFQISINTTPLPLDSPTAYTVQTNDDYSVK